GDGDSPSGTTVRARVVVTDLADGARVGILGPDGGVLDAPPADEGGGFTLEAEVAPGTSLLLVVVGGPDGAGAGTRGQQRTTGGRRVMATAEVQYAPCADPGDDPHASTPTFLPAPEAGEVPTTAPGRTSEGRPDQAVDTTAGEGTTDTAAA